MARAARTLEPFVEGQYWQAQEVEKIAFDIINEHHDHLINTHIEYVFRAKASKKHGAIVLGKARKISGLTAYLAGGPDDQDFFVVEIAHDEWTLLNEAQRVALVDHELSHLYADLDTGKLEILPHDLEEFRGVVQRHGLWSPDVRSFAKIAAQAELPFKSVETAAEAGSE